MADKRGAPTDDFFVGYLPAGAPYRRAMRAVSIVLGAAALGAGVLLAAAQRDPGRGRWPADATTLTGQVVLDPYATLRVAGEGGRVERVLLVEQDKTGAGARASALGGRMARLRGTVIERNGQRMLALDPGTGALEAVDDARPLATSAGNRGIDAVLRGVIVDPKCYFGAMKPGVGKAHRSCAALCIFGGIPPVLAGEDGDMTVLAAADGSALDPGSVVGFVDEPVEVRGTLLVRDGQRLLLMDGPVRRVR